MKVKGWPISKDKPTECYNYNISRFSKCMSYISLKTSSHKGNAPWIEIIKYKLDIKLNIFYRRNWL